MVHDNTMAMVAIGIVCFTAFIYSRFSHNHSLPAPLPPGPKGFPLIGNAADLTTAQPWKTFEKWGETYGPITHATALGKSIIVLNDPQYAFDMFAKKSRKYSDRPELILAGRLVGWDESRALINSESVGWNAYRRFFAQFMGTRPKIEVYEHIIQDEATAFLKRLLDDPAAWTRHAHMFSESIMLMLAYGYKLSNENDEIPKLVNEGVEEFTEVTSKLTLVEILPILRYIPEWFPGAGWKKKVLKYRKTREDVLDVPYQWTKKQMAAGMERPSFVSSMLSETPLTPENEIYIKWAANGIHGGGTETTLAGIELFFLAMTIHTDVQQKAQAEIDRVIGTDRLPTFADRAHLSYVELVYLEVLRMYPLGPIGIPRVSTEDDVHKGLFIPKGSIVFSITGQYLKDSNTYKNPDVFNPERFIASEAHPAEKDPREYIFGFGRRACPGQHLGDATMWILCTSLLASFVICPPFKDGMLAVPSAKIMAGSVNHPEPFEAVIKPRSQAVVDMLNSL